jgi:hypothetical protein
MVPANQGLHPDDLLCPQAENGLVVDLELLAFERVPDVGLDSQLIDRLPAHMAVENLVTAGALGFGSVHGRVGVPE